MLLYSLWDGRYQHAEEKTRLSVRIKQVKYISVLKRNDVKLILSKRAFFLSSVINIDMYEKD